MGQRGSASNGSPRGIMASRTPTKSATKRARTPAKKSSAKMVRAKTMPPFPMEGAVVDKQAGFVRLTRTARPERDSERIFLASKREMLRTHPGLSDAERIQAETLMAHTLKLESRDEFERRVYPPKAKKAGGRTPPVPGGVGYGMFYTDAFRVSFSRGTSFYYEIVCPHQPGGK